MQIRHATLNDVSAIARIHVTCWHETYTGIIPKSYLAQLDIIQKQIMWNKILNANQTVFIAEINGQAIGFANAGKNNDNNTPYPGELYTLYVLKSAHKIGIGKNLFMTAKSNLLNDGLFPFITHVLVDTPALGFYRHMGAEIVGEHLIDFNGLALKELQLLWK